MADMKLIGFRVPKEARKKLEEIAKDQHRPLANMVRTIVLRWLEWYHENPREAVNHLLARLDKTTD